MKVDKYYANLDNKRILRPIFCIDINTHSDRK